MLTNREKLTAQAQKFIERGQYDKAVREYLKIVAEDEKDVRTWLKIGDLFAKIGQKGDAAQTYQKVAQFYSDQGFYLKAVAVYKQILKIDPRLIEVNIALAELYRQLGLAQDTISHYEIVASFLQQEGRTLEAVAAHRAILELDPNNVAQRIKLAELYSKEEMLQEAAREFSLTADQLRVMGRVDDLLKVGERLLFHEPDNRLIAKELAALYIQRGDARRALTKLQASFKADPKDQETLELLAQAFWALGQNHKCISVLKELARICLENEQPDQAAAAYERILSIDPADEESRTALHAESDPANAQTHAPAHAKVHRDEQIDAADRGAPPPRPRQDRPFAQGEPHRDEEVARIVTEADVYAKYGLYQKAIEHVQRALEQQPNLREVRERLYELYEATDRTGEAVTTLWSLVDQAMTQEDAARYLGEILRIDPENKDAILRWRRIRAASGAARSAGDQTESIDPPGHGPPQDHLPFGPAGASGSQGSTASEERRPEQTLVEGAQSNALRDDLAEIDFFWRQNMRQEARLLLDSLLLRHPRHPLLIAKLKEIGVDADGSGILAAREMPRTGPQQGSSQTGQVYEVTRQGLRQKGGTKADYSSYFDLAMAYRDMGLYADAITELKKAMMDSKRELQCRVLIGLCYAEQNMQAEAISELKRALYVAGATERDLMEIYYHLGRLYEQVPDKEESLYFYEKALQQDPNFRDAKERISNLRAQGGEG